MQLAGSTFSNLYLGSNSSATVAKTYDYYPDGHNWHASNGADARFDRAYTYDHAGRLQDALSGTEARGGSTADGPYRQTYSYDAWTSTTGLSGRIWSQDNSDHASYTNNRRGGWGYDAEGHALAVTGAEYSYDVGAKPTSYTAGWVGDQRALEVATNYDGNGTPEKQVQTTRYGIYAENGFEISTEVSTTYYLRSTALGGKVVAELGTQGEHVTNHIYAGGMEVAQNFVGPGNSWVTWQHTDPLTGSSFTTDESRTFSNQKEIDPLGDDVTTPPPPTPRVPPVFRPIWPVEATWGPSEEFLRANAEWGAKMDFEALQNYAQGDHPNRAGWEWILHKNPNLGLSIKGHGTLFGEEAAHFIEDNLYTRDLHPISLDLSSGPDFGDSQSPQLPRVDVSSLGRPPINIHAIYCNPRVIQAMKDAWGLTGNGGQNVLQGHSAPEAGFNLNGTPSNFTIDSFFTNEPNQMKMPINDLGHHKSDPTFANFHVHNRGHDRPNGMPSTPENNAGENNREGDTGAFTRIYRNSGQAIQVYVMSQYGLSMFDPKTGKSEQLRQGLDFLKPCT
jgi:hypothetical protein